MSAPDTKTIPLPAWVREGSAVMLIGLLVGGGGAGLASEVGASSRVQVVSDQVAEMRGELRSLREMLDEMRIAASADAWGRSEQGRWQREELAPRLGDLEQRVRRLEGGATR